MSAKEAVGALSIRVGTKPGQIVPQGNSYTASVTIVVIQCTQSGHTLVVGATSLPAPAIT